MKLSHASRIRAANEVLFVDCAITDFAERLRLAKKRRTGAARQ